MGLNNVTRFPWLVTLCIVLSGCTTYRPAAIPGAGSERDSGEGNASIRLGDTVRIVLHSGETVSGKVLWITKEEIALGSRGNYGDEDLVIKVSTIDLVEVRDQSDGQIEGRWFIGLGVAALIAAYVSLRSTGWN